MECRVRSNSNGQGQAECDPATDHSVRVLMYPTANHTNTSHFIKQDGSNTTNDPTTRDVDGWDE